MILVAGGTGLLGRDLVNRLSSAGHPMRVLTRDQKRAAGLAADIAVEVSRSTFRADRFTLWVPLSRPNNPVKTGR